MTSRLLLLVALAICITPVMADQVDVDIQQPVTKKPKGNNPPITPLQPFSGWAFTVEMTMKGELGIGVPDIPSDETFPVSGRGGFVVFSDPDDCLVLTPDWGYPTGAGCVTDEDGVVTNTSDETYFEFTPDTDAAGTVDFAGNSSRMAALVDSVLGPQEILPPGAQQAAEIGPYTGDEVEDGYGFGADDDVPGLVVVAPHGAGIVYDASGVAASPMALRNLAGFANSVTYELNNAKSRTTVTAQIFMPSFLIAPLLIADESYGVPPDQVNIYWRVDGAAMEQAASDIVGVPVLDSQRDYPLLVRPRDYTITALVVSGTAPDSVTDMNGDMVIDENDLELMGYTVLGDAKSVTVQMYPGTPCFGGSRVYYADLDGNGTASFGIVCPAGPGSVSEVPR